MDLGDAWDSITGSSSSEDDSDTSDETDEQNESTDSTDLGSAWDEYTDDGSSSSGDNTDDSSQSDGSDQSDGSNDSESGGNEDAWWYYEYEHHWMHGTEAVRMAPMQTADEADTIEVRVFHTGNVKAARVCRVYIEAMLRDAWGDSYHIDVSLRAEPVRDVVENDDWWDWVDENLSEVVKDCNVLVPNGGGWGPSAAADTAIAFRAGSIANLYGSPLFVSGDTDADDNLSTVLHEVLHCLGLDHCDGGVAGSGGITPMGHYCETGDTYHHYVHPNTASMDPDVK